MAIKIETYTPKHLSLEAKIFEEHNIMSLVGDMLNIEVGYRGNYHRTPFIKTEFTEDQHRLESIFRYVWSLPRPFGDHGKASGWYDVSGGYANEKPRPPYRNSRALESYYRTPTGHREIHRMVQHHQEYLDVLPEQYEKIPHSATYRELVGHVVMASYWYDFVLQKNIEFSKKMEGITRDTYWSHIDADPFMEELSIFLGYVEVAPIIDHPEQPEPSQMAAAIRKLARPSFTSCDETYGEPQLKIAREELEEENARNFREWLKNTTPGYFATHSNHSGKLTETGGLELEVIHVTFQSRQNNTAADNLAMATTQRKTNSNQLSLFDESDYYDDDCADDDDDLSTSTDGNDQYTQAELDNHANQCNPNNDAYESSRA